MTARSCFPIPERRRAFISFISPSPHHDQQTKASVTRGLESGNEVKHFYEAMCSTNFPQPDGLAKPTPRKSKRATAQRSSEVNIEQCVPSESNVNRMMFCAQKGDVSGVQNWLDKGLSIDIQDSFGWTALMCASHAGKVRLVQYLITKNADLYILNKQSLTAYDLAVENACRKVERVLAIASRNIGRELPPSTAPSGNTNTVSNGTRVENVHVHCDTCDVDVTGSSLSSHDLSTVHLFNRNKHKEPSVTYNVPESNRGFQMMLRTGWDRNAGLGPSGSGTKAPIKTVLKRDRTGLGVNTNLKARVTHFKANDESAVTNRNITGKVLRKHEARRRQQKGKNWERRLRFYMNTD